jgi:hypothetical protein
MPQPSSRVNPPNVNRAPLKTPLIFAAIIYLQPEPLQETAST